MEARQVAVTAPLSWIQNAASLFFSNFLGFVLTAIAYLAILFLLGLIPILGQIASLLLTAILIAGLYTAIREAKSGQAVKVGQLFSFLSHERTGALVRLSLAPLAFAVLLVLLLFLLAFAHPNRFHLLYSNHQNKLGFPTEETDIWTPDTEKRALARLST